MTSVNLKDNIRPSQSLPYEEDMHSPIDSPVPAFERPVAETTNIDAISQFSKRMREALELTAEDIVFLEDQHVKLRDKHAKLTEDLAGITAQLYNNERVRAILEKSLHNINDVHTKTEQAYYNEGGQ